MNRTVHGIGVNDLRYPMVSKCIFYKTWKKMLGRCYDPKYQDKRPSYVGCYVCKEWHLFSNFKNWMETQDWKGKDLDKDIISPGNKQYSPEYCAFVPKEVNSFFTFRKNRSTNLPCGVSWCPSESCYKAYCADLSGKNKTRKVW